MSLQLRLVLICLALLVVGLLAVSGIVSRLLQDYLVDRVDEDLRPFAAVAARISPSTFDALERAQRQDVIDEGLDLVLGRYIAYLAPDGGVERVARSVDGGPSLSELPVGKPVTVEAADGDGRWRVMVVPRVAGLDGNAFAPGSKAVVGAPLGEVDATIGRLRATSVVVGGVLLVVLAVVGWFAVRAGLRPLRRIESTAAAIAEGDLTHRVPELGRPRTELGRLSAALNGMLGQVERAFAARSRSEARMRRFVADVSHELRTPLFGIKGFTELYRMGGLPTRSDVDRTMGRIERESSRLADLTEDLLLLAQLDEGATAAALELAPMDLRTLAADALHDVRALDPTRSVSLTGPGGVGPPGAAIVLGDESRLRQAMSNLLGNAVTHTPAGTAVRLGVGLVGESAVLEVADSGPGLSSEDAARVFERFYRADGSRSRSGGGGAGLGLSIARSLIVAHGGRLELVTALGEGATFRIVLPTPSSP
jgi:two-component system OmpR family sensor kinase